MSKALKLAFLYVVCCLVGPLIATVFISWVRLNDHAQEIANLEARVSRNDFQGGLAYRRQEQRINEQAEEIAKLKNEIQSNHNKLQETNLSNSKYILYLLKEGNKKLEKLPTYDIQIDIGEVDFGRWFRNKNLPSININSNTDVKK